MKAQLRSIESDFISDLQTFVPDPAKPFTFDIVLRIGAVGNEGADLFFVTIMNPLWLMGADPGEYHRGYGCLIVDRFQYEAFAKYVDTYVLGCEGETWYDVVRQITQLASWEYDGMERELREQKRIP